ncbi:DUF1593-domain-containing protein [Aspergillus stella-maris]|uniref:DUF1593-domain-containing protein n=1 Tax=Aspergillus stella-maris TaxID=1810926 RepID=UPI003CCCA5AA
MRLPTSSLLSFGLLATAATATPYKNRTSVPRTLITTDMESDDLTSLIRYLLYTNELDTQAIIYSSSRFHWSGDGAGTKFFLEDREYDSPQWNWRWVGTRYIQDIVLPKYSEVWPNLNNHDPFYPSPDELVKLVKIGNVDFEGEMSVDTEGSDFIKELLLDEEDERTLYMQAWGGTNVIARALKSIEDTYSTSSNWTDIQSSISKKSVILASGFQDNTYTDYIAPNWPSLRVEDFSAGYATWAYNCDRGQGNIRGLDLPDPDEGIMPGDALDTFGNETWLENSAQTCKPLEPYAFLSEGDNVVFYPLLNTGLQDPSNPELGNWGGRSKQNSSSEADLWELVESEKGNNGSEIDNWTFNRWIAPIQNDFAARMQWTLSANYSHGNHAPVVEVLNGTSVDVSPGESIRLVGKVSDPDGDTVATSWWQYEEEGSYEGTIAISPSKGEETEISIPSNAKPGESISIIFQGTDNSGTPLTRYSRVMIHIV